MILAIPPIFTNAYVGIRQVDPDVVDAARGMGMTGTELVRRVELPLSLPLVFGGIRTSVVNVLATATLGPFVGVDDARRAHHQRQRLRRERPPGRRDPCRAARGGRRAALRHAAAGSDAARPASPSHEEDPHVHAQDHRAARQRATCPGRRRLRRRRRSAAAGGGTTTAAESAKAISSNPDNASKPEITIGSKNFTEDFILGEVYAQALKAAGYKVRTQLNLGSEQIALRALESGRVDAYPEYTGTALTSFCDVKPADVPRSEQTAYDDTKACLAKEGLTALPRSPFTNSNGFAVTQKTAQELGGITTSVAARRASPRT